MGVMSDSLLIILGVVPEAISEWNPDNAPHITTIEIKGQTAPDTTGPPPPRNGVVPASGVSVGRRRFRPGPR
jgi:hypothetical protein